MVDRLESGIEKILGGAAVEDESAAVVDYTLADQNEDLVLHGQKTMTAHQLRLMVDFIEKNPILNCSKLKSQSQSKERDRKWVELSIELNAPDNEIGKSAAKWQKSWTDYKNSIRIKDERLQKFGSRNRRSKWASLTPIEKRVLRISDTAPVEKKRKKVPDKPSPMPSLTPTEKRVLRLLVTPLTEEQLPPKPPEMPRPSLTSVEKRVLRLSDSPSGVEQPPPKPPEMPSPRPSLTSVENRVLRLTDSPSGVEQPPEMPSPRPSFRRNFRRLISVEKRVLRHSDTPPAEEQSPQKPPEMPSPRPSLNSLDLKVIRLCGLDKLPPTKPPPTGLEKPPPPNRPLTGLEKPLPPKSHPTGLDKPPPPKPPPTKKVPILSSLDKRILRLSGIEFDDEDKPQQPPAKRFKPDDESQASNDVSRSREQIQEAPPSESLQVDTRNTENKKDQQKKDRNKYEYLLKKINLNARVGDILVVSEPGVSSATESEAMSASTVKIGIGSDKQEESLPRSQIKKEPLDFFELNEQVEDQSHSTATTNSSTTLPTSSVPPVLNTDASLPVVVPPVPARHKKQKSKDSFSQMANAQKKILQEMQIQTKLLKETSESTRSIANALNSIAVSLHNLASSRASK